jgi:hypothetical protein
MKKIVEIENDNELYMNGEEDINLQSLNTTNENEETLELHKVNVEKSTLDEFCTFNKPSVYKIPLLESVEVDKTKVKNTLDKNETYFIIYSETCILCQILLKYIKYIDFNHKLIHVKDLNEIDSNIKIDGVPYIINSKKEKVNINSLLELLKEHNIKSLK